MEERRQVEYEEDGINLDEYLSILRSHWWKIAGISLGVGILTLLYMFTKPNLYRSTAVITPEEDQSGKNPAYGTLASFGISVGGPTKVEDLEALFKSKDLTVRVFGKYDLWPIVMPDRFDPKTGKMKAGFLDRFFGRGDPKPPGDWDAIRLAEGSLTFSLNRKSGNLSISFQSRSPEGSAAILGHYLEEAKNRLQEEAFSRANNNKTFIKEQISKTVDALTRDRLYALYGQEVEREMLARNREQFGFRVIDSPRVPDRKSRPSRGRPAMGATLFAAFLTFFLMLFRDRRLRRR